MNLAAHAVHLLMDRCGDLAGTGCRRPVGFVCDDGQRRLQAVRKIASLGNGAFHGPIALFEQRVEVVNQRLHL